MTEIVRRTRVRETRLMGMDGRQAWGLLLVGLAAFAALVAISSFLSSPPDWLVGRIALALALAFGAAGGGLFAWAAIDRSRALPPPPL